MLYERQKRILTLLDALGGQVSALDFQKLLFLFCQEAEETPSYAFVPYRFGAFSFISYSDKRRLIAAGLLADDDKNWRLTDEGRTAARNVAVDRPRMTQFCQRYSTLGGDALIADTYRRYPYYATRSEMLPKLDLERDALQRIESARPAHQGPGLYTIGYEGRSLDEYLNILLRSGVTLLCDVRRNPLSRKYGFSKSTLGKSCVGVGIRYEHLPELGIASERRRDLETQADYDALFAQYRRDWLPGQNRAVSKIRHWIEDGERLALTCYERQPEQCHRHCVAEILERTWERGLHAVNL